MRIIFIIGNKYPSALQEPGWFMEFPLLKGLKHFKLLLRTCDTFLTMDFKRILHRGENYLDNILIAYFFFFFLTKHLGTCRNASFHSLHPMIQITWLILHMFWECRHKLWPCICRRLRRGERAFKLIVISYKTEIYKWFWKHGGDSIQFCSLGSPEKGSWKEVNFELHLEMKISQVDKGK